jgi:hypothetical protein
VVAPVVVIAALWSLLTGVKALLLVHQAHQAGLGMGAFQAWPAETASLLGLLLAMPIAVAAQRKCRSVTPAAPPLLLLLLGWALFSIVHLLVTLGGRSATVGLDESYSFSSARDWVLQLGESTFAFLIALAVLALFRRLPSPEENGPERQESAAPARSSGSPTAGVVRLSDGGRELEVSVRELLAVSGGGNYIELIFRGGSRKLLRTTLNAAQLALEPFGFRRTHKSWLVRLDAVSGAVRTSSGDFRLELGEGLNAPLSRRNRSLLEQTPRTAPADS